MAQKVYLVLTESKQTGYQTVEKVFDTKEKAVKYADKLRETIGDRFKLLWQQVDVE